VALIRAREVSSAGFLGLRVELDFSKVDNGALQNSLRV
jgi:hypothetical protein